MYVVLLMGFYRPLDDLQRLLASRQQMLKEVRFICPGGATVALRPCIRASFVLIFVLQVEFQLNLFSVHVQVCMFASISVCTNTDRLDQQETFGEAAGIVGLWLMKVWIADGMLTRLR